VPESPVRDVGLGAVEQVDAEVKSQARIGLGLRESQEIVNQIGSGPSRPRGRCRLALEDLPKTVDAATLTPRPANSPVDSCGIPIRGFSLG